MIYVIAITKPDGCEVYYRQHAVGYLSAVADMKAATHYSTPELTLEVRRELIYLGVTADNMHVMIDQAATRKAWWHETRFG